MTHSLEMPSILAQLMEDAYDVRVHFDLDRTRSCCFVVLQTGLGLRLVSKCVSLNSLSDSCRVYVPPRRSLLRLIPTS